MTAVAAGPEPTTPEQGRRRPLLCPSADPGPQSVVFAVRGPASGGRASVRYLDRVVPASAEVLAMAEPVDPREVFRFGAPCAEGGCQHFDGRRCGLGGQVVAELAPAVADLPRCHLRSRCRWFAERGGAACLRCPVVVTMRVAADDEYVHAVRPRGETSPSDGGTP